MSVDGNKLVGQGFHVRVDTCVNFQIHQNGGTKGSVCLLIPIVERTRRVWYKAFMKIRVPFDFSSMQ